MQIKNGWSNGMWKPALKTAVSAVSGVIIANLVDQVAGQAIISWSWWKHVLIASGTLVILNEARFWRNWADSKDDAGGSNVAIVIIVFFSCIIWNHWNSITQIIQ